MMRCLPILMLMVAGGCGATADIVHTAILPEQRTIETREFGPLSTMPLPVSSAPRTVLDPRPDTAEWRLSLDEAIRIGLDNSRVVRTLAGLTAVSTGKTIYDAAITNTTIDQQQARFDPIFAQTNTVGRNATPSSTFDTINLGRAFIAASPTDTYRGTLGLSQTNTIGGQYALNWLTTPTRIGGTGANLAALNPQTPTSLEFSYTQPLLQGAGFRVNRAPIVIARINTEISFFQYKASVQELVRSVAEAYWNLVQARIDAWARKIQVDLSESAHKREQARLKAGLADLGNVAQAKLTWSQFKAARVAADAIVMAREGALRNVIGLPPTDDRVIVPVSAPTNQYLKVDWTDLVQLSEARRPDIVELKLILDAEQQRLIQAENQTLPTLNAVGTYRWNGLSGSMPNGETLTSALGANSDWSVGVNFSVPLGLRLGRAQVRQERLLIERDRANLYQGLHNAIHELTLTIRNLDNAYAQYQANKEVRAAAEENLKVQSGKFKVGQSIYLNVLQALNDWGNAINAESQSLLSYNIALATLERQTGTILETHGLVFAEERFRFAGPLGPFSHGRSYPTATVPVGESTRYPTTGEPSENVFNLHNPVPRKE